MQKLLVTVGLVLLLVGVLWPILEKSGLGRLPGDIDIRRGDSRFYFPIVTCLVVSAVLTLVMYFFRR